MKIIKGYPKVSIVGDDKVTENKTKKTVTSGLVRKNNVIYRASQEYVERTISVEKIKKVEIKSKEIEPEIETEIEV